MMRKYRPLFIIQLKEFIMRMKDGLGLAHGSKFAPLLMPFLIVALFGTTYGMSMTYHDAYAAVGAPEITITVMYMAGSFLIFFLSMILVPGTLFYAKDTAFFITLPVTEDAIVFSKIGIQYVTGWMVGTFFLLPAYIIYWASHSLSWYAYLYAVLLWLLMPMIPLVAVTLIMLIGMKWLSRYVRYNLLAVIFGFLSMVVVMALQILLTRQAADPSLLEDMIREGGLLSVVGAAFPPSVWATRMFLGNTNGALLFVGVSAVSLAVLHRTARPLFKKSVGAFSESDERKMRRSGSFVYVKRSMTVSLVLRNLGIIVKTPIFLLNVSLLLLLPLVLVVMYVSYGLFDVSLLRTPQMAPWIPYIQAALVCSPALVGTFSATAVTREGPRLWQSKSAPIRYMTDVHARVLCTMVLCGIGIFCNAGLALILFPMRAQDFLVGLAAGVGFAMAFSLIDLMVDLIRPILDWTNPTHAIKNNMNVIFALMIRVAIGAVIYVSRSLWQPLSPAVQILGLTGCMLLLASLCYVWITKNAAVLYGKMEF